MYCIIKRLQLISGNCNHKFITIISINHNLLDHNILILYLCDILIFIQRVNTEID